MNSTYLIVKTTPFPPITGFEKHEYAYYKLKRMWTRFRGDVKNLDNFILAVAVRELDTLHRWVLCAEYKDKKLTLNWRHPKQVELHLVVSECLDQFVERY